MLIMLRDSNRSSNMFFYFKNINPFNPILQVFSVCDIPHRIKKKVYDTIQIWTSLNHVDTFLSHNDPFGQKNGQYLHGWVEVIINGIEADFWLQCEGLFSHVRGVYLLDPAIYLTSDMRKFLILYKYKFLLTM